MSGSRGSDGFFKIDLIGRFFDALVVGGACGVELIVRYWLWGDQITRGAENGGMRFSFSLWPVLGGVGRLIPAEALGRLATEEHWIST